MNACDTRQDTTGRNRVHFLDNLRTFVIFLVVLYHAGGVYEASGMWGFFWIVDDPATNNVSGLVGLVLDIFVMATIFFISGYLVPASLKRRTGWTFLRAKFARLMVPWIVAVLTLIPLYQVIFLHSRGLPQEHWTTYFHWSNGTWSQNWLWFLPVLFLFNLLYLLLSKVGRWVPEVSLKGAVPGTFVVGFVYSVGMDVFGLRGWTKTVLLDFQNERLLIYFLFFLLGALCFRREVFDSRPKGKAIYLIISAVVWIPVTVYVRFLFYPWLHPSRFIVAPTVDRLILWFCFHVSLLCLVYLMIETFRRYLDRPGRRWRALNRNSYSVYILHVVVMGGVALILLDTAIPSIAKHVILTVSTYGACHCIVSCGRRVLETKMGPRRLSISQANCGS